MAYSSFELLKRPRITEKGSQMAETATVAVFEVPLDANKTEIKKAVQAVFGVEVSDVRTMIVRGKIKRRGRHIGKRPNWKKAWVTLAPGSGEIEFFEAT